MKKQLQLLVLSLLWIIPASAQTPQFSKCCGTASSQFPFKNNGGAKTQLWYNPSDFTVLPQSGNIRKVYFRSQVAGQSGTYTNFKILLKQPALGLTQFSTSTAFEVGGFTQVLSSPSLTINGATSIGGWYEITLDNSFYYDNTRALIIETQFDAPFGGVGIDNYGTATTNFKKIYAATLTATTGTASNGFWQDFGFDISSAAPNNAGISALVAPKAFCVGSHDIVVRLKNNGSNVISTVNIKWTLDGVLQTPLTWSWPLDTLGGTLYRNDTAITLGTVLFGAAAKTIKVWTEFPNTVADTVNIDDTLNSVLSAALSGTYTIGGVSPNYATMLDAVNALKNYGICGPVIFNVASGSGPYTTNLSFNAIPGSSAINTITFNGNGATISSANTPLIAFSGSSYITLDSFNIIGTGAFAGFGIHAGNLSHHLTIKNNKINVGATATATTNAGIVVSGSSAASTTAGNNARFLTITNNEITGGYYGIVMVGSGTYLDNGAHTITNNKIKDFYLYGVYLANTDTATISSNDINRATRATVTTLGGIYLTSCRNVKILNNKIHDCGVASYTAYPIQIVGCVNTAGFETEISNNLIYNIGTTAIFHGITFLTTASTGFNIYHNTIQYDVPTASTSVARGVNFGIAITNFNLKNNLISITGSGTGIKTGIYVTTTSTSFISNNNVINVATSTSNNVGFWTTAQATLINWQTASSQDALSVTSLPVFANLGGGNLSPLSSNCDNIGTPIASVTTDITGALRSTGTPDAGAYEFTGIAGDIGIIKGELKYKSTCYSTLDTINLTIKNVIGTTINFAIDPVTVVWKVTGPVNTVDSFMVNSGTLNADSSLTLTAYNVNMSKGGSYNLTAYLKPNAVNLSTTNDTLAAAAFIVRSILEVTPKTITVTSNTTTVELIANSTLFPGGGVFFSEIAHYKVATGQPTAGWPAYMLTDDYVELTGVPNSDLAGYTMEEWTGTATTPQHSVTFPSGTLFSPNGTMILATGQLGSSVPVPSSFYYHTGNTVTHSSTGDLRGYVIKNSSGTVIDAATYGAFTFPTASGVTAADWSGATPVVSSSGNTLNAPDNNTSSCWVNSGTVPQTPNVLNAGITAPAPSSLTGFDWNYLGSSFATTTKVTVGPYTVPGVYKYVASYTNMCGTFYDTAYVTAGASVPVKLTSFTATKANADVNLNWNTASEVNNSHFEIERSENDRDFKAIGRVKGNGTTSKPNRYAFVDVNATNTAARTLYYRLKQVDNDGSSTYSKTEVVTLSDKRISGLSTHPNPSNGVFTISAEVGSTSAVNMKVVNIMGATVWSQTVNPVMGANAFETQLQLPNGVYMLLFEQNGETSTHKFVITH